MNRCFSLHPPSKHGLALEPPFSGEESPPIFPRLPNSLLKLTGILTSTNKICISKQGDTRGTLSSLQHVIIFILSMWGSRRRPSRCSDRRTTRSHRSNTSSLIEGVVGSSPRWRSRVHVGRTLRGTEQRPRTRVSPQPAPRELFVPHDSTLPVQPPTCMELEPRIG